MSDDTSQEDTGMKIHVEPGGVTTVDPIMKERIGLERIHLPRDLTFLKEYANNGPEQTLSLTAHFDTALKDLNRERGSVYGTPLEDFNRVAIMSEQLDSCSNQAIRHCMRMIVVKLSRLVQTPDHLDSMEDIAGYARCMAMVIDEQRKRRQEYGGSNESGETGEGATGSASGAPEGVSR